jgi:hypothetical protein
MHKTLLLNGHKYSGDMSWIHCPMPPMRLSFKESAVQYKSEPLYDTFRRVCKPKKSVSTGSPQGIPLTAQRA